MKVWKNPWAVMAVLALGTFAAGGSAQEASTRRVEEPAGNPLSRILYGNYTSPPVRNLEVRGDGALESLIRDGKLPLSEEDAIRLALEGNVDINVERYAPYFTLWGVEKGEAVLNPTLAFTSSIDRLVTPTTSPLQGGETLLNLNNLYDVTVHKPFEPGLDLDFNFNTRRARSNSFFTSLNPSLTSGVSLSLTQHLLKDFGRITRGRHVRIARNNYDISEETFVQRVTDIVNNVLTVYWDLVFYDEDIRVKEASRKLAEVVLEQNKIQAEVGTMAPLDVVQAEAEVAARNEQLVVSRYTRRITEDQLKKLISSRLDPGLIAATIIPTSTAEPPRPPNGDVAQSIQRAMEIRPEVKQALLDLDNRKIQVDYTRNQLRPTLDLIASYSQNGLGGDRILRDFSQGIFGAPVIGVEPGGFWNSIDSLFSQKYVGYSLGFNLRIPVGNDEARANNAQAKIDYRQGEERLRSLRQRIALEVRDAYNNIEMNRARREAAEVTVRYQERRLQGEQDKYSLGATTTRFILEAQRDLQDAQSRLLKAKIDLIKSRVILDKAVGDTFAAHNIEQQQALGTFR
jgi:outer membrane protein TolC